MDAAQLEHRANLICIVTGTVLNGIRWSRPNGGSPQETILCNNANTECETSDGITGYSAVIDSPTRNILTIESFNAATDEGEWSCRDGAYGDPSSCEKTVARKLTLDMFLVHLFFKLSLIEALLHDWGLIQM